MDWDDLHYFLAVARHGGLSPAARELGVNHATVLRRLRRLETALEVRLFERSPSGYVLTPSGEEILPHAERMEVEALGLDRRVSGRDVRLSGSVRLTTVDSMANCVVPSGLEVFHRRYPGIDLELVSTDSWANLSRREADVALRPSNQPGDTMIGRRVAELAFCCYAAPAYADARPPLPGVEGTWHGHVVILGEGILASLASDRWLRERAVPADIGLRTTSFLTQAAACRAGLGIACLPCYMGDADPGLERVGAPLPDIRTTLWLLTHPDLRRAARIRAVLDWLSETVAAMRPLIEGRKGRSD